MSPGASTVYAQADSSTMVARPANVTTQPPSPLFIKSAYKTQSISEGSENPALSDITTQLSSAFSRPLNAFESRSQIAQSRVFLSGDEVVQRVAEATSDNVFIYSLFGDSKKKKQVSKNKKTITMTLRAGAASALRGAVLAGSSTTAIVPSQALPLFLPNITKLANSNTACVFHVSSESVGRGLTVSSSYESIYALQNAGVLLLNSSSVQECHDMAILAHIAAKRFKKLVVHFYDSSHVARAVSHLDILDERVLQQVLAVYGRENPYTSLSGDADLPQQIQSLTDDLFPIVQRRYKMYDYHGHPEAEDVVVVVGEAANQVKKAVAYEQMLGNKVGVIHVRILLPWSHALFAAALPATVKHIAILENTPFSSTPEAQLLTSSIQVFVSTVLSQKEAVLPVVRTGFYGGGNTDLGLTVGMARGVFNRLQTQTTCRSFILSKTLSDDSLGAELIDGQAFELPRGDPYSKQLILWAVASSTLSVQSTFDRTLQVLNNDPGNHVSACIRHGSEEGGDRLPVSTMAVQLARGAGVGASSFCGGMQSDISVALDISLLEEYDVLETVATGGTLLVNAKWQTWDDVEVGDAFKAKLALKSIQLKVVNIEELAGRVEDAAVAQVGLQIALLNVAALYDEQIVFGLLRQDFPEDKYELLRLFADTVYGEIIAIDYPSIKSEDALKLLSLHADNQIASPVSLGSIQPTLASLSTSNLSEITGKLATASTETQTAWKFVFSDAYESRQDVRDHVTSLVKVTKWERLTPLDYSRNVFHMEMEMSNTKLKYNIGEALAVFAHNDEKEVLQFLQLYNVDPDTLVTLPRHEKHQSGSPVEETVTLFQLFSQILDVFGRPSKKFYEALARLASNEKEKEYLTQLLSSEGKEEYKKRVDETVTFAELLVEFPSARPSLEELLVLLPRIKPRHYSIASSMKMNPTSVHLLVVLHDWTTPSGKYRIGQATRFLSAVTPGQILSVAVCSSVMKLPVNHSDPVIMAGLGTGMAPFRAFIQERAYLKAQGVKVGPMALYFGSRHKKKEYLYGDELDAYEQDGLLTYLRCAFSRDQVHKVYIQDKIAEDKALLYDLLVRKNGHFYLCGPTWPVADVRAALLSSFTSEGDMDLKQANAYLEQMREEGRYVLEVY